MEIKEFAQKVHMMRKAQCEYFKARKQGLQFVNNEWYTKARKLETEVDKLTEAILSPTTQGNLY